jgi:hypothetical protein
MAANPPNADPLKEGAAPRRPFDVHRLVLYALLVGAAFSVTYLVAANIVLRTRLLRDVLSEGPDIQLDYTSAYSVWPGMVHVRNFSLEVQNSDVQLSVAADSGVLDISLHELLLRRFHATNVDVQGLSYRFRHRVGPEAVHTPRVAAYPSIRGFSDPPLYVAEDKPSEPPSSAVWRITLEDITAEVSEIWVQEYRFVGAGVVKGGFQLEPARRFQVYSSSVALEHGELSVGDALATSHIELQANATIEATEVATFDPAVLIEHLSGRVALTANGLSLAAIDSRAAERESFALGGRGDLSVSASLTRGRLDADGSAELQAKTFSLTAPFGKLSGVVTSKLTVKPGGRLQWLTTCPSLALANATSEQGPTFGAPRLAIGLSSELLASWPSLSSIELDAPQIVVPSLAWAQRWMQRAGAPVEVGGKIEGRARLSWAPEQGPRARVRLELADAQVTAEGLRAALGGSIEGELEPMRGQPRSSSGHADIHLDGVAVQRNGQGKPKEPPDRPFRAAVSLQGLKVKLAPDPALSANVMLDVDPADSLLSLALGSPLLEDLATDLFSLRRLEASASLHVGGGAVRLELARAESGALTGVGYWQRPAAGGADGAFLISSKIANVGISLSGQETETDWFVPNDWLASRGEARAKRSRARSGKQRPSRALAATLRAAPKPAKAEAHAPRKPSAPAQAR